MYARALKANSSHPKYIVVVVVVVEEVLLVVRSSAGCVTSAMGYIRCKRYIRRRCSYLKSNGSIRCMVHLVECGGGDKTTQYSREKERSLLLKNERHITVFVGCSVRMIVIIMRAPTAVSKWKLACVRAPSSC